MKLRYAIPFTLFLLITSSWLSGPLHFNVYYALIAASALWCSIDSWRIGIQRYNTQLALPPVAILVVIAVAWPIAFPFYLRTRYRLLSRQLATGPYQGGVRVLLLIAGVFAVLFILSFVMTRNVSRSLMPVAVGINEAFLVPVNVNRHNTRLIITIPYGVIPDAAPEQYARDVASCAKKHYADFVSAIEVRYSTVEQRGALTVTRFVPGDWWGANELTAFCPKSAAVNRGIPKQQAGE